MTEKQKAKQLIEECGLLFGESYGYNFEKAKQCAIKVVDEIMIPLMYLPAVDRYGLNWMKYYSKVKSEIEKIPVKKLKALRS